MTTSTFISAKTKDYVLIDGQYKRDNELLTEIYTRIVTPLGTYPFNKKFGCELANYFFKRKVITSGTVTRFVTDAVTPTIVEKRAKQITAIVNSISDRKLILTINVIDMDSKPFQFTIPYTRNAV